MQDGLPEELAARMDRWDARMEEVAGRLERIERRLGLAPMTSPAAVPVAAPPPSGPAAPPLEPAEEPGLIFDSAPPVPETPPAPSPAAPLPPRRDWEGIVGGRWALWVGTLAVFLSVAFFLAYAWEHLGPWMRLGIGGAAAGLLLSAGEWARGRTERGYGAALAGGGLAVLYLDAWAAAQVYHVLPYNAALALMVLITVAGVALALHYDAVALSALAAVGGFLTPALLESGAAGSGGVMLFAYVAVLNAGLVTVAAAKRWQSINALGFIATVLLLGGWALDHYTGDQRWPVFAWLVVLFLLFAVAAAWDGLKRGEETSGRSVLLLFGNALAFAVAGFAVVRGVLPLHPGVFPLAMAAFFALAAWFARAKAPQDRPLRESALALALLFFTAALPIELRQGWLAFAWSVEAAALLALSARSQSDILRKASNVVWVLAVVVVFTIASTVDPARRVLLFNERALPLLALCVMTAGMAAMSRRATEADDPMSLFYAPVAVMGGAWLIAQETWAVYEWQPFKTFGPYNAPACYRIAAQWAVYAFIAYTVGLWGKDRRVYRTALLVGVLAALLTVGTQILFDAGGTPFWNARWLAFAAVTAALAGIVLLSKRTPALDETERNLLAPLSVAVLAFALWGLTAETYLAVRWFREASDPQWRYAAHLAVSLLWSVCGTLLLAAGATLRRRSLRLFALALFGLTVVKVFFVDLGFLQGATRVLSFGGLGVALLLISWLYSRYGVGREDASNTEAP